MRNSSLLASRRQTLKKLAPVKKIIEVSSFNDSDDENVPCTINMQEVYESNEIMSELSFTFNQSLMAVEEVLMKVIKKANKMISQRHYKKVRLQLEDVMDMQYFTPDGSHLINHGLIEEPEPQGQSADHWSSYKINVAAKKKLKDTFEMECSPMAKSRNSRAQSRVSVMNNYASPLMATGRLTSFGRDTLNNSKISKDASISIVDMTQPADEDPLENGMRLAYEREIHFKSMKDKAERQREDDLKEHIKQMKTIQTNTGVKQFTYDFEGKLLIQNGLNYEKMPPTAQQVHFDVNFIGKTSIPDQKVESQVKQDNGKKKMKQEVVKQVEGIKYTTVPSQLESISLEKGVTFLEGKNVKYGPQTVENLYNLGQLELSYQLSNPNLGLKLSKAQYESILKQTTHSQSQSTLHMTSQSLNAIKPFDSSSMVSIPVLDTVTDSINSSMGIPKISSKSRYYVSNSINGSMLHQNGSIRVNSNSSIIIDELVIAETSEVKQIKKLPTLSVSLQPQLSAGEQYAIDLMRKPDWGNLAQISSVNLDIQKLKLPSKLKLTSTRSTHALPMLIKNPRQRITSVAQVQIVKVFRLPPSLQNKGITNLNGSYI